MFILNPVPSFLLLENAYYRGLPFPTTTNDIVEIELNSLMILKIKQRDLEKKLLNSQPSDSPLNSKTNIPTQ